MIDDLAGLLKGELRIDPLTRAMYATDASLYQMLPYVIFVSQASGTGFQDFVELAVTHFHTISHVGVI